MLCISRPVQGWGVWESGDEGFVTRVEGLKACVWQHGRDDEISMGIKGLKRGLGRLVQGGAAVGSADGSVRCARAREREKDAREARGGRVQQRNECY